MPKWKPALVGLAVVLAVVLFAALAALVLLPLPRLDAASSSPVELAAFEAEAGEHFARILAGEGLQRPFPAPVERPGNPSSAARIELGRQLFFDPILSGDNTLSCAHCHHPDLGFADGRGRSMGRGGKGLGASRSGGTPLRRGAPSLWNVAYNPRQFWDGRARDLEEQAAHPIQEASEMDQDPQELVAELAAVPEYVRLFAAAFEGGITFENVTFAVAAFERTLLSRDAPFDRYARGERGALSGSQRRGLNLFRSLKTRCFECHRLPTFADGGFKVIGVPEPAGAELDLGRGDHAFKVPTLRNVASTAPYMHNGRLATLGEVLDFYAAGGGPGQGFAVPNLDDKIRPFALSDAERRDLIAFLGALSDTSARPVVPERVPSGLPVVERLAPPPESREGGPVAEAPRPPSGAVRRATPEAGRQLVVEPGERIQAAIDAARPGDTVLVRPGVYPETLTLDLSGITLKGEVVDGERAVLDGGGELADAIIGSGSELVIEGFAIRRYTANGVMVHLGRDLTLRDLHTEDTGLYGLYPVEVVGVVIEDSSVTGARDAGIYVGQSRDIVVRRNAAFANVTGIEIENSVDAVVEDNEVWDNTGGILVFGLPGMPSKVSRACRVVGNRVWGNNRPNFADPNAIVAGVPAGTGILILASDELEVTGNTIRDHGSFGIAVAGLDSFFVEGTAYDIDPYPERCRIHGNELSGNGFAPAASVVEAGYTGADLLWDLSGTGHSWHQPGASSLPPSLPAAGWPSWLRRLNGRLWRLLAAF